MRWCKILAGSMSHGSFLAAAIALALLLAGTAAQAKVVYGYSPLFTLNSASAVPGGVPHATGIAGVYPNPFNPRTTIAWDLAAAGRIDVSVYDLGGRLVRRLESGSREAGRYETAWDGTDEQGRSLPTGTYFCRLVAPDGATVRKMMLAK